MLIVQPKQSYRLVGKWKIEQIGERNHSWPIFTLRQSIFIDHMGSQLTTNKFNGPQFIPLLDKQDRLSVIAITFIEKHLSGCKVLSWKRINIQNSQKRTLLITNIKNSNFFYQRQNHIEQPIVYLNLSHICKLLPVIFNFECAVDRYLQISRSYQQFSHQNRVILPCFLQQSLITDTVIIIFLNELVSGVINRSHIRNLNSIVTIDIVLNITEKVFKVVIRCQLQNKQLLPSLVEMECTHLRNRSVLNRTTCLSLFSDLYRIF